MDERLFSYCLQIADREFMIQVTRDGFIHWDDYQHRRRVRNPAERGLELHAIAGSERARKRLVAEIGEFTVSLRLSPKMFARFSEAARLLDADGASKNSTIGTPPPGGKVTDTTLSVCAALHNVAPVTSVERPSAVSVQTCSG